MKESADQSRGGSSTMPQKANPVISEGIIAIGRHNAQLLASLHQAMIQEHERATHGWQLEWLALPQMCVLTGAALRKAIFLGENLVVNAARMRANVKATQGLMLAEAISLALAAEMGREPAKKLVTAACGVAFEQGRHLIEVVREQTDIELNWDHLQDEANYLGAAQVFIDRVLGQV